MVSIAFAYARYLNSTPFVTKAKMAEIARATAEKSNTRKGLQKTPPSITRDSIGGVLRILRKEAPNWNAPVMTLKAAERHEPFRTLIGCLLSLRTRDQATAVAAPRLFEHADTPARMLELSQSSLNWSARPLRRN